MEPSPTRFRLPGRHVLAPLLYVLLALIVLHPAHDLRTHALGDGSTDVYSFIWYLSWWPWAVAHGHDPIHSRFVWYPLSYCLAWATSVPAAALLALPITLIAGAAVSFNVLSLLAAPLAAWSAYLLARQLRCGVAAALLGGFIFGFSPYEFGQLLGHLNLDLIFLVPLIALLAVRRVQGGISRLRFVLWTALALTLQFGLSIEVFATLFVFGGLTWAAMAVAADRALRGRLVRLLPELAAALALTLIAVSPFLIAMARDAGDLPPFPNPPQMYSTDLLNLVVPTAITGPVRFALASRFTGNISEQGGYLGIPLLVILAWLAIRSRNRLTLALVLVTLLIGVLSLGPTLWIGGRLAGIALPWALAMRLPLIQVAIPSRFSMFVALGAGLAAALFLSAAGTGRARMARWALAGAACLFLLPDPRPLKWTRLPLQPVFEPVAFDAAVGRGANVLILPFLDQGAGMLWQWQSRMHFTQTGGYVGQTPRQFGWPVVLTLLRGVAKPGFVADLGVFCRQNRATRVLAGPGTPASLLAALLASGWRHEQVGGVTIFRVPELP